MISKTSSHKQTKFEKKITNEDDNFLENVL